MPIRLTNNAGNSLSDKKRNKGFTLVELMVASTLASLMSFGVLSIYVNQSGNITSESQRDTTKQAAHNAFDIVNRLVRQAKRDEVAVTFVATNQAQEGAPDYDSTSLVIDFNLPQNQQIWPNTNGADNAVRIVWGTNENNTTQIQIGNTQNIANLDGATLNTLAGSNNDAQPRISNMVFWPLSAQRTMRPLQGNKLIGNADNGYLLQITARAGLPDLAYSNPEETGGSFERYRTYTVSGVVFPRN